MAACFKSDSEVNYNQSANDRYLKINGFHKVVRFFVR